MAVSESSTPTFSAVSARSRQNAIYPTIHYARRPPRSLRASDEENTEEYILGQARDILMRRMGGERQTAAYISSPGAVRDYLRLTLGACEREEFWCLWLDAQHRVIAAQRMFSGTLTQTSVYPREIVKAALGHNCAAAIFAHNHPSGVAEPSASDQLLTRSLKAALALVDVQVLDHFIVAGSTPGTMSFAERGLL